MATTPAGRVAVSRRICWIWRRPLKAQSLMNAPFDPTFLVNESFAVGQPVSRKEDPVLLRGEGRYSAARVYSDSARRNSALSPALFARSQPDRAGHRQAQTAAASRRIK